LALSLKENGGKENVKELRFQSIDASFVNELSDNAWEWRGWTIGGSFIGRPMAQ
jgi:hypothetical protein